MWGAAEVGSQPGQMQRSVGLESAEEPGKAKDGEEHG